jgi:hypothetical protein
MIEVINTYEGREFGVKQGGIRQIFRKIYRCTKCGETFESKEKGTHHANSQHKENSYRLRDADTKRD